MTKNKDDELEQFRDWILERLDTALDPELTREELVAEIKDLYSEINGDDGDDDENQGEDTDEDENAAEAMP